MCLPLALSPEARTHHSGSGRKTEMCLPLAPSKSRGVEALTVLNFSLASRKTKEMCLPLAQLPKGSGVERPKKCAYHWHVSQTKRETRDEAVSKDQRNVPTIGTLHC